MLENAQTDLTNTKNMIDKENDNKAKQENNYHQIIEEKAKLVAT